MSARHCSKHSPRRQILPANGIQGYPTIIVLNSEGKKVGKLGYQEGGPKAFIAKLDELKGK